MYEYDIRVGFSQSDEKKRMTIPAIIDAFQDCSCFHSDDVGVGFDYLEPLDLVWIINYWEVEIERNPMYGERLKVGTFAYDFKGFFGYRNFYLRDNDDYIVKANSLWVLMDWTNMRPAKVTDKMKEAYEVLPRLDMSYSARKIIIPEAECTESSLVVIGTHHLDTNGHVNNGQYIKIAMEALSENLKAETSYHRLRVEYRTQAHLGDTIVPKLYVSGGTSTISLADENGGIYSAVELCR